MKNKIKALNILILFLASNLYAQSEKSQVIKKNLVIGESIEIQSKILKENRILNIYLPAEYAQDATKSYPVIYVLDGSIDEDFIHIAGIVQFGSFSWINMIPESIVVGIANIDRKRDFTFPTTNEADKKDYPTTGESSNFITFIEKELQPLINKNYRTTTTKTIIGQSLGGLLATEILFKKPDLFDNYIIVSPSLWWDDESLLKVENKMFTSNKAIYIAVGKEGKIMEKDAKALYKKLKNQKNTNAKLYFKFFEKQSHADALHLAVYDAFENIFRVSKK